MLIERRNLVKILLIVLNLLSPPDDTLTSYHLRTRLLPEGFPQRKRAAVTHWPMGKPGPHGNMKVLRRKPTIGPRNSGGLLDDSMREWHPATAEGHSFSFTELYVQAGWDIDFWNQQWRRSIRALILLPMRCEGMVEPQLRNALT